MLAGRMAARSFFTDEARARVRAAVERIEAQTSAEVVVTVRRVAGRYRDADYLFGAILALVMLGILLFAEAEFSIVTMPLDVAMAFALGALACAYTPTLRRALASRVRRRESARRAACEAFLDQGIGRTSDRTGILVLVAVFEREVSVVWDIGLDPAKDPALAEAVKRVETSIGVLDPKLEAFVEALEGLGPVLGAKLPRRADDVNELPDDVGVR